MSIFDLYLDDVDMNDKCYNELKLYLLVHSHRFSQGKVEYKLFFNLGEVEGEHYVVFTPEPINVFDEWGSKDLYQYYRTKDYNMYKVFGKIFEEGEFVFKNFMKYLVNVAYPTFFKSGRIPRPYRLPVRE